MLINAIRQLMGKTTVAVTDFYNFRRAVEDKLSQTLGKSVYFIDFATNDEHPTFITNKELIEGYRLELKFDHNTGQAQLKLDFCHQTEKAGVRRARPLMNVTFNLMTHDDCRKMTASVDRLFKFIIQSSDHSQLPVVGQMQGLTVIKSKDSLFRESDY